jgi:hypothetical protein
MKRLWTARSGSADKERKHPESERDITSPGDQADDNEWI